MQALFGLLFILQTGGTIIVMYMRSYLYPTFVVGLKVDEIGNYPELIIYGLDNKSLIHILG